MRVLHLVGDSLTGGAALGALRVHEGLRIEGVDSHLACQMGAAKEIAGTQDAATRRSGRMKRDAAFLAERLWGRAVSRKRYGLFSPARFGLDPDPARLVPDADILHLHWIAKGFVSMGGLRRILAGHEGPVIWTLRDMWPLTGGCHYSLDCHRYAQGCGHCPALRRPRRDDLSARQQAIKRGLLPHRVQGVAVSSWIAEAARASGVFRAPVPVVPNSFDPRIFYPDDRKAGRRELGITDDRPVVLTGAASLTSPYKGFDLMRAAMTGLAGRCHFVVFGATGRLGQTLAADLDAEGHLRVLGRVPPERLRRLYSAADLFVAPSRQEAFAKTVVEAMGCGCPVVAFDGTGAADAIEHGTSGYLVGELSAKALEAGIAAALERAAAMRDPAHSRARTGFTSQAVARRYVEIYRAALADPARTAAS